MESAKLHRWVADYNWDDGLAPMWTIVDSVRTEFATALMIYWRLGGPYLEAAEGHVHDEAKRLQSVVRDRLLADFYPRGSCQFDPLAELSRVQLYQLRKSGVPEILLSPTVLPNRNAAPGRPGEGSGTPGSPGR